MPGGELLQVRCSSASRVAAGRRHGRRNRGEHGVHTGGIGQHTQASSSDTVGRLPQHVDEQGEATQFDALDQRLSATRRHRDVGGEKAIRPSAGRPVATPVAATARTSATTTGAPDRPVPRSPAAVAPITGRTVRPSCSEAAAAAATGRRGCPPWSARRRSRPVSPVGRAVRKSAVGRRRPRRRSRRRERHRRFRCRPISAAVLAFSTLGHRGRRHRAAPTRERRGSRIFHAGSTRHPHDERPQTVMQGDIDLLPGVHLPPSPRSSLRRAVAPQSAQIRLGDVLIDPPRTTRRPPGRGAQPPAAAPILAHEGASEPVERIAPL